MIMVATVVVDFSIAGYHPVSPPPARLHLEKPLPGASCWSKRTPSSVNSNCEAFIVAYRMGGAVCTGCFSRYWWVQCFFLLMSSPGFAAVWLGLLVLGLTLGFSTGDRHRRRRVCHPPVSVIDAYVLQNPDSTSAVSRQFARLLGYDGLIGFHQAWTMMLAAPALALVALLHWLPLAKRKPLLAAPVFSVGMVLLSYTWFQFMPVLRDYPTSLTDVLLAVLISTSAGLLTGSLGLWLAGRINPPGPTSP
jgi:hypothetical protein